MRLDRSPFSLPVLRGDPRSRGRIVNSGGCVLGAAYFWCILAFEIALVLDVALTFCRAYYADSGLLISRPRYIRSAYMSSAFYLDVLSRAPFDLILRAYGAAHHQGAAWLRLPRVLSAYALSRKPGYHASARKAASMLGAIFRLLGLTALVTHFYGCVWWLIGTAQLASSDFVLETVPEPLTEEGSHWVFYYSGLGVENLVAPGVSIVTQYSFTFYWVACTLSTAARTGFATPKNMVEVLFTIFCMLTTLTFYAYVMGVCLDASALTPPPSHFRAHHCCGRSGGGCSCGRCCCQSGRPMRLFRLSRRSAQTDCSHGRFGIAVHLTALCSRCPSGQITNLVLDNDEALVQKRQKVQLVQSFIGKRRLKREVAKDVVNVCYEKINVQRDTDRVFDLLPSSLRIEVAMHISLPLVKNSHVFGGCSASFAASLSVLMREMTFAGDETIFRTNDVCGEMYIIANNAVQILGTLVDGMSTVCAASEPR